MLWRKNQQNFHSDKIPKEGSQCICLSVVLIDSIYKIRKNYYPPIFLAECKYVVKKEYIVEGIEISTDDSDEENSIE